MNPLRLNPLRRKLLLYSAPVVLTALIAIVALLSVVVTGQSATSSFADRDTEALTAQVGRLSALAVIEPGKADFAAGSLAVLQDRLADADRYFTAALARLDGDESCSARVNLEFVRETLGDRAAAASDTESARHRYLAARDVVTRAPAGCFAGNEDPDADRRILRHEASARLDRKLADRGGGAAVPPPPPPVASPPPAGAGAPSTPAPNRLDPAGGDPLDRLQQILRDAATG
ncbi:hypothetical protein FR943_26250 [Mycobacterium sp. TNTM28]|uniref:Histidine kinase n=1 Tax=[Mycobacterium] fortunisiensis TaxID=2600579 RepID=A0ABS6KUJ6_9MYCO|nr:hypothetical protein [[Mycobacterium] fortunisiensis]MBU9767322.1 hypothetical protein [[Mycobacterium] fortunisiensis]